jgi:hypothetical protein
MAVYLLVPPLTDEFIHSAFYSLVLWEAHKEIGLDCEVYDGCQTGYIACLADMFGECSEDIADAAWEKGETWIHAVEDVLKHPELASLVSALTLQSRDVGLDDNDFQRLEDTIQQVTKEWVNDNIIFARKAIQNI